MTSRNDITGDKIQTKPTTKEYEDGWDRIFGGSSPANGLCKKTPEGDLEVQVNGGQCCGKCKEEKEIGRPKGI